MPVLNQQLIEGLTFFSPLSIVKIAPLLGGISHQLYLIDCVDGMGQLHQYVLRYLPDKDRARQEFYVMQRAFVLGLAPEPLALVDVSSQLQSSMMILILPFISGKLAVHSPLSSTTVQQIVERLACLHSTATCHPTMSKSTHGVALLQDYWRIFKHATKADIVRFDRIMHRLSELVFNNNSLIHGDLNLSNIMITPTNMYWIDWEFSTVSDCYVDYATLCVESDQAFEAQFIKHLTQQLVKSTPLDIQRLLQFKLYYAACCWLWTPWDAQHKFDHNMRYKYATIIDGLLDKS